MKCKFYSEEIGKCLFDGPPNDCPFDNKEEDCACFRPIEYEKESPEQDPVKMNNLFKTKILAYNKEMLIAAIANNFYKFMADTAVENPSDMMLIQFKDIDTADIDIFVEKFRRIDCQYVFEGKFYSKHELIDKMTPYCKEMCISVVPKMPKNSGDFINTKKDYGYLTIATMTPTIGICDEVR